MARVGLVCTRRAGAEDGGGRGGAYWVSKTAKPIRLTNEHQRLLVRDRLADLVLACNRALESMRWTRHMRYAKNLQNGLVRMPALRKRMKAPLVMMPCRMPCDSTNGTNQTQQHALVAWHRLLAVPRTSLVKSSALLSSETSR